MNQVIYTRILTIYFSSILIGGPQVRFPTFFLIEKNKPQSSMSSVSFYSHEASPSNLPAPTMVMHPSETLNCLTVTIHL